MTHTFVTPSRWTTSLLALLAMTATTGPASALTIKVLSITAAPGASSGFLPNDRLGLIESKVGVNTVTHIINQSDCEAILAATTPIVRLTWNWSDYATNALSGVGQGGLGTPAPRYVVKVATPDNTCDVTAYSETTASITTCSIAKSETAFSLSGTAVTDQIVDINLRTLMGSPTSCTSGVETKASIYFIVGDTGTNILINGLAMDITIDTKGPVAPTVGSVSAGNANLKVSWTTADNATTTYSRVYWSTVPFTAAKPGEATSRSGLLTGSSYQITGLTNGETYYVAVTSIDANENESVAAKVIEGSPVPVQDLWQTYKASGGAAEGGYYGCSAQPTGPASPAQGATALALLILAGLALRVARRRRLRALLIAVLVVTSGVVALPQQSFAASPRTMSLDLRGSYYTPMIDREFSKTTGATPYGSMMTVPAMMYGAAIDWRLWHGFGEFGVGFSVGHWSQTGKALRLDGTQSNDSVELVVMPVTVDLVYRFNWLAEKYDFPLVPYVRGGLAYGFWWMNDGTGKTSTYTGVDNKVYSASGGIAGLHATLGLRLLLDVFEPKAARGFDIEMGVNHSYLFVEYQRLSLTNFGDAKALDLSDDVVTLGIAFDL